MTRNDKILDLYVNGETMQRIGDRYSISRERVRQILHTLGAKRSNGGASLRARRRADNLRMEACKKKNVTSMRVYGVPRKDRDAAPVELRHAYLRYKRNHGRKRDGFHLTLSEWLELWAISGLEVGDGQCVRRADGPYEAWNLIVLPRCNSNARYTN